MPQFKNYVTFYQPEKMELASIITSLRLIEREINYLEKSESKDFELGINEALNAIQNINNHFKNLGKEITTLDKMRAELIVQKSKLESEAELVKN